MNIALQDIVFPRSCPVCGKVTKNGADICPECETELCKIGSQVCYKCGQPVTGASDMWCPSCAKSLRGEEFLRYQLPQGRDGYAPSGGKEHYFTQARSLYRYNGAMRQSIYRLKYKNAKEYAIYYGKQMAEYVAEGAFDTAKLYDGQRPGDRRQSFDGRRPDDGLRPGDRRQSFDGRRPDDGLRPGDGRQSFDGRHPVDCQWLAGNQSAVYDTIIPVPMYRKKQRKRGYNQAELLAVEMGYCLEIPVRRNYLRRVRETAPMKELSRSERRKNLREAFAVRDAGGPAPKSVLLVDDIYTTGATADACAYALRKSGVHRIDCLCLAMEDLSV